MATRKPTPKSKADAHDPSTDVRDQHGGGDATAAPAPSSDGLQKKADPSDASDDPQWNREFDSSRNGRGYGKDGSHVGREPDARPGKPSKKKGNTPDTPQESDDSHIYAAPERDGNDEDGAAKDNRSGGAKGR